MWRKNYRNSDVNQESEINTNTNSNKSMPSHHRSLWWECLCSLQCVSVLNSSHKNTELNHGYGSFFVTYNKLQCSLFFDDKGALTTSWISLLCALLENASQLILSNFTQLSWVWHENGSAHQHHPPTPCDLIVISLVF